MPVPLRRPRTPPALPPSRVPPPSFRGFLTSSYAPPIRPGPSRRIVLCEPVGEPTGLPKTEPAYGFSAAANTLGDLARVVGPSRTPAPATGRRRTRRLHRHRRPQRHAPTRPTQLDQP